jgi:choline kinase
MKILIPAAGKGDRFIQAGFNDPKPLIDVNGKKMIVRALGNFNRKDVIVITRQYDNEYHNRTMNLLLASCNVINIDYVTEGAACTCLLAKEYINNDEELLILDCDAFYKEDVYWFIDKYIRSDKRIDSCGVVFNHDTPKNSYVKVDADGWAIETAEKKVISNLSFTGMHWFRKGKYFVEAAEAMIAANDRTNNEFYVSPSYNYLFKQGRNMKPLLIPNEWVTQVGTPQDLVNFLNKELTVENRAH